MFGKTKGLKQGDPCPPFSLPDIHGEKHNIENFREEAVLLYFMRGTW
ncbi:hypothetical protein [Bacillus sp. FJAT-44742]|nr:hypothetical protein [Bacillus sp. FJAT-44742]